MALFFVLPIAKAQSDGPGIQIGIFGNPGISSTYGDYPSTYNASVDFSFSAGARVRVNQAFGKNLMLAFDFGFLEIGYNGRVDATDSYFFTSYDFLTINLLAAAPIGSGYVGGGFYYAPSLGGDQYREYTDEWVTLEQKSDMGLLFEAGKDLGQYFTVGLQGRLGLVSIGESVEIKTWALHGKIGINIFSFDM
jgi:hypothetical protein